LDLHNVNNIEKTLRLSPNIAFLSLFSSMGRPTASEKEGENGGLMSARWGGVVSFQVRKVVVDHSTGLCLDLLGDLEMGLFLCNRIRDLLSKQAKVLFLWEESNESRQFLHNHSFSPSRPSIINDQSSIIDHQSSIITLIVS